jgi:hypothetical protein
MDKQIIKEISKISKKDLQKICLKVLNFKRKIHKKYAWKFLEFLRNIFEIICLVISKR